MPLANVVFSSIAFIHGFGLAILALFCARYHHELLQIDESRHIVIFMPQFKLLLCNIWDPFTQQYWFTLYFNVLISVLLIYIRLLCSDFNTHYQMIGTLEFSKMIKPDNYNIRRPIRCHGLSGWLPWHSFSDKNGWVIKYDKQEVCLLLIINHAMRSRSHIHQPRPRTREASLFGQSSKRSEGEKCMHDG